jgi:nitrogen regulatory protein P-II 1
LGLAQCVLGGGDSLQLISAIVQPSKVDEICDAVQVCGFHGFTVIEAVGFGKRQGRVEVYRGTKYRNGFQPKAKIEIVAADDEVQDLIQAICKVAASGRGNAGKIWVTPVSEFVHMSTKETGIDAH